MIVNHAAPVLHAKNPMQKEIAPVAHSTAFTYKPYLAIKQITCPSLARKLVREWRVAARHLHALPIHHALFSAFFSKEAFLSLDNTTLSIVPNALAGSFPFHLSLQAIRAM